MGQPHKDRIVLGSAPGQREKMAELQAALSAEVGTPLSVSETVRVAVHECLERRRAGDRGLAA